MTLPLPPSGPRPSDDDDPFFAAETSAAPTERGTTVIWAAGVVLFLVLAFCGRLALLGVLTPSDSPAAVPQPTIRVEDLQAPPLPQLLASPVFSAGECLATIGGAMLDPESNRLPCSEKHVGEVFEVMPISGDTYPGED